MLMYFWTDFYCKELKITKQTQKYVVKMPKANVPSESGAYVFIGSHHFELIASKVMA